MLATSSNTMLNRGSRTTWQTIIPEDISKKLARGLKGRNVTKVVEHHANTNNPERCFVSLFQRYRQLCPNQPAGNAFYLQPSKSSTTTCWQTSNPLGHTKLGTATTRRTKQGALGTSSKASLHHSCLCAL